MALTSIKCDQDNPIMLAMALNIAFVLSGIAMGLIIGGKVQGSFLLGTWVPVTLKLLAITTLLAIVIVIGSVGAAVAYQKGPPATIAAFDYSYLVFSLLWGVMFFAELPDQLSLLGILVITIAGIIALLTPANKTESTNN